MHLFAILLMSITALAASPSFSASTATIYAWPLSASSPTPLAKVSIFSPVEARLDSYTHPTFKQNDEIVRIGLYDTSSKQWIGVATSASTLDANSKKRLTIHLDEEGKVWNVGISTAHLTAPTVKSKKANTQSEDEQIILDVRPTRSGPSPILNKPVVLNAEGKLPQGPEKDESSFKQKYWWAIALFVLLQVLAGGGGKE